MKYVDVAVPSPLRLTYTYQMPSDLGQPFPGQRVLCSFGKQKKVVAIIIRIKNSVVNDKINYKSIEKIIDHTPIIPEPLWNLIQWAADYYLHPLGDAIFSSLPVKLKQGHIEYDTRPLCYQLKNTHFVPAANATQQHKILALFSKQPLLTHDELKQAEVPATAIKNLLDKEILQQVQVARQPVIIHEKDKPKHLSDEQTAAIKQIQQHWQQFHTLVLQGITGSGKTEVFLQLIEHCLQQKQQVLVMVPEISLTPQTLHRFNSRFRAKIALLHSGLTDNQRFHTWLQARNHQVDIVIGTRSSIFTPFKNLGLMIVDEEHDASYKQQEGYRYHARDLACKRAHLEGLPLILASATPSLEALYNVEQGLFSKLYLTQRLQGTLPEIVVADMKKEPVNSGLSQSLLQAINHYLSQGQQVLLFINRRGFAPVLQCKECAWLSECKRCDAKMTLHKHPYHLHCHHCNAQRAVPRYCPQCLTGELMPIGQGTEKVENWLQKRFPDKTLLRIDRDSTSKKNSLQNMLQQINNGEVDIIIGTQMLAKGHHFPKLGMVGILDVDGAFFTADFRGSERLCQLVMQVSGRAGREQEGARVILQTSYPEHPLIALIKQHDYSAAAHWLLQERQQTLLPPYYFHALLRCNAMSSEQGFIFLEQAKTIIAQQSEQVQLIGPMPAPIEKKSGKFRFYLMIEGNGRAQIRQALINSIDAIAKSPLSKRVRWHIDIDPKELL